jgi:glycosyltransferase involved in cell wall biosynthesis
MAEPLRIHVITACRNAEAWLPRLAESLREQSHGEFSWSVYDDASTDGSVALLRSLAAEEPRLRLLRGSRRGWAARSRWRALASLEAADRDLVVLVDGDDWLAVPEALEILDDFHRRRELLVSHGTYRDELGKRCTWAEDYPLEVKRRCGFRSHPWIASHPRTFRYGLFRQLAKDRRLAAQIQRYRCATDLALFLPILELAGEHSAFCSETTYVYNTRAGQVMEMERRRQQKRSELQIRRLPALRPLPGAAMEALL